MTEPNLFSAGLERDLRAHAPLASRMRPRRLDEVVGQEHLLGPDGPLRRSLESGTAGSMIFFGPPGSGKTTVARLVADALGAAYSELSAVSSGVADVRKVLEAARNRRETTGTRTVLFIDEIHRFSKAQQDALLHAVEDGLVLLVGATTENPYFEVISPLISRAELYRFQPLEQGDIRRLLDRALAGEELGLNEVTVPDGVRDAIARDALGDARRALNTLERAAALARAKGAADVDEATVEEAAQRKLVLYDKDADAHYDTISAFIKSLRGSDPDAALYYLAVMLTGGEDPKFIARRLIVFASEDVGNADPRGLEIAVAAARAVEFVGLPEARINLAHAVTYLAAAPKSNASYMGLKAALSEIEEAGARRPPAHLRDAHYSGAKRLGHGAGYVYPHGQGGYVDQTHLPPELVGREFYHPTREGEEAAIAEFLARMRRLREGAPEQESPGDGGEAGAISEQQPPEEGR